MRKQTKQLKKLRKIQRKAEKLITEARELSLLNAAFYEVASANYVHRTDKGK